MLVGTLMLALVLGLIPAAIAQSKGRSFMGYWLFGTLLFIVALPVALLLQPDRQALDAQALASGDLRKCQACAELIRRDATVCRYCGHAKETEQPNDPSGPGLDPTAAWFKKA